MPPVGFVFDAQSIHWTDLPSLNGVAEPISAANPSIPFPAQARAVVRAVRGSFGDLLAAVRADPQDLQSISKLLGLNKNLAWKISKIVQADDPSVALEQMPGSPGLRIFLESAERAGIAADLIAAARQAIDAYEELIEVHSGEGAVAALMFGVDGRKDRASAATAAALARDRQTAVFGLQVKPRLMQGSLAELGFDPREMEREEILQSRRAMRAIFTRLGLTSTPIVLIERPALRAAITAAAQLQCGSLVLPPNRGLRLQVALAKRRNLVELVVAEPLASEDQPESSIGSDSEPVVQRISTGWIV